MASGSSKTQTDRKHDQLVGAMDRLQNTMDTSNNNQEIIVIKIDELNQRIDLIDQGKTKSARLAITIVLPEVCVGIGSTVVYYFGNDETKLLVLEKVALPQLVKLVRVYEGSVCFVVETSSLSALIQLWTSYKDGSLREHFKKVINEIDEVRKLSDGTEIELTVKIDEEQYREAYWVLAEKASQIQSTKYGEQLGGDKATETDESKQAPKNSRASRETGAGQEAGAGQEIDSGRAKLSLADPLDQLWNDNIYFRDEFSEVLDRTYKEIDFWPHLAEQFGIDKCIYDAFSTSDITSPTEAILEYLETREPTLNVKEFYKSLKTAEALEVCRIVEKCVKDGKLSEMDLVTEMCDKVPRCLETIILKLDRVDRLWKNLARVRGIPQKKFLAFQSATNDNPTRVFFDLLRTEAPELSIKNFREKLKALGLENLIEILKNSAEIRDDMPLNRLSKHPDVKSAIESILNELKTNFLWTLASRYQKEGLMQTIDIETLFGPKEQVHTPTCKVIEYALASRSKITTIEDLIIKLKSMRREDCVQIIVPYLKGGKQEIDKITQGTQNLQIGSCDEGNPFSYGNEEPNGTQVTTEQVEANNKFIAN